MHRHLPVDRSVPAADAGRMTPSTLLRPLAAVSDEFSVGRGYLAACTVGPPTASTRRAVVADVTAATAGDLDIAHYCAVVERSREHYARLVGVRASRVAIGSQASVYA